MVILLEEDERLIPGSVFIDEEQRGQLLVTADTYDFGQLSQGCAMQNNIDFKNILRESGMPVDEQTVRDTLQQVADDEKLITNTSRMSPFWALVQFAVITPYVWIVDTLTDNVLA